MRRSQLIDECRLLGPGYQIVRIHDHCLLSIVDIDPDLNPARANSDYDRRKILHCNVTEHSTGAWIVQQLREAFRESCSYRYLILDRDAKFGTEVIDLLAAGGIKPTRTSPASPWQNGIAERWIGSCRRELLDYVIVLKDIHVRRLIRQYISYYHADRIHDSLEKESPAMRPISSKPDQSSCLASFPHIGGLHHRYDWQQAA